MSRRGRSGPTISLFSFQDIITSVTAIVTVVTLLLALDLVNRKPSPSRESASSEGVELARQLESAEAELAQLRARAASVDELVQAVAALTPAELRRDIAMREARVAELERKQRQLLETSDELKSRLNHELAGSTDHDRMSAELARLERSNQELERQRTEENAENRTVFSLPRGFAKEGWIVEVDTGQIQVAPIGRAAVPISFSSTGVALFSASVASQLEKWIDEQNLIQGYFLLLIRPDAGDDFKKIQQMLERKKISHGYDVVDNNQTVLHAEKGAAH